MTVYTDAYKAARLYPRPEPDDDVQIWNAAMRALQEIAQSRAASDEVRLEAAKALLHEISP